MTMSYHGLTTADIMLAICPRGASLVCFDDIANS